MSGTNLVAEQLFLTSETVGATEAGDRKLNDLKLFFELPAQMALPESGFLVKVPITGGCTAVYAEVATV